MKYRLIFLDAEGRAQAYDDVLCRDDVEAARLAKATGYQEEIQIWLGGAIVRRLNSRSVRGQSVAA